ncbi:hypothetical protein JJB98_10045 [Bradyrhizobium diazoefficiens]|nr:hypothetical protein [Bradyrhizobium diazoefficiens]QQO24826.1 hypothetical protein JJB98_10045 [Bradyrhizobium diazoefficiens]
MIEVRIRSVDDPCRYFFALGSFGRALAGDAASGEPRKSADSAPYAMRKGLRFFSKYRLTICSRHHHGSTRLTEPCGVSFVVHQMARWPGAGDVKMSSITDRCHTSPMLGSPSSSGKRLE